MKQHKIRELLTVNQVLAYEVFSSWWAGFLGDNRFVARYFAWKVRRKYRRYKQTYDFEQSLITKMERPDES